MAEEEMRPVILDRKYDGLVMVVSPQEALRRVKELEAFIREVMVSGLDYGVIPGTDKPTLLQPGAQKLVEIYGFAQKFEDVEQTLDWDRSFFFFRKRCVLSSRRDGEYVGDGFGSCNSRESKYAWRWVFESEIPPGVDRNALKSETRISKKTRRPYTRYRLANEDIASQVNTIEKIACKRALVHAVIGATRSSGIFTQDVEDFPREMLRDERHRARADDQPTGEDERAVTLREKLEAASNEQELRDVMTEIGQQNGLSASSLDVLRGVARKLLEAMRAHGAKERDEDWSTAP